MALEDVNAVEGRHGMTALQLCASFGHADVAAQVTTIYLLLTTPCLLFLTPVCLLLTTTCLSHTLGTRGRAHAARL